MTTSSPSRRSFRTAVVVGAAVFAATLMPLTSHAAEANCELGDTCDEALFSDFGAGYNLAFDPTGTGDYTRGAGAIEYAGPGGLLIPGFCVEAYLTPDPFATFGMQDAELGPARNIDNLHQANYAIRNASQLGTPATDENVEFAAIQVAVWSFTSGVPLTTDYVAPAILPRATEIAAAVLQAPISNLDADESSLDVSITDGDASDGSVDVTVQITGGLGAMQLVVTGGTNGPETHTVTGLEADLELAAGPGDELSFSVSAPDEGSLLTPHNDGTHDTTSQTFFGVTQDNDVVLSADLTVPGGAATTTTTAAPTTTTAAPTTTTAAPTTTTTAAPTTTTAAPTTTTTAAPTTPVVTAVPAVTG